MVDVMENIPVGEIAGAAVRFWDPSLNIQSQLHSLKRYNAHTLLQGLMLSNERSLNDVDDGWREQA